MNKYLNQSSWISYLHQKLFQVDVYVRVELDIRDVPFLLTKFVTVGCHGKKLGEKLDQDAIGL